MSQRHEQRRVAIAQAQLARDYIDPSHVFNGKGSWHWLIPAIDEPLAASLGISDPLTLTMRRELGTVPPVADPELLPIVRYGPDYSLWNIEHRPSGRGRFEYTSVIGNDSTRAMAEEFAGGHACFTNTPMPTAEQLWNWRMNFLYYQRHGQTGDFIDITHGINIVWVAEDENTPVASREPSPAHGLTNGHASPASSPARDGPNEEIDEYEDESSYDEGSDNDSEQDSEHGDDEGNDDQYNNAHVHDPTNRGANNQTGNPEFLLYQTRIIDGTKITVDRSRAHAGSVEQHKTWIYGTKGWRQWQRHGTLNWNDKDAVEMLNKWREQEYARAGWPHKRGLVREAYSEAQKDFLFVNFVKPARGGRPTRRAADIVMLFNARFGTQRSVAAITAILERQRKQLVTLGDRIRPGTSRRKEGDEDDADDGSDNADADGDEADGHAADTADADTDAIPETDDDAESDGHAEPDDEVDGDGYDGYDNEGDDAGDFYYTGVDTDKEEPDAVSEGEESEE